MSKQARKIVFGWDSDGGFIAGEVESGVTAYAYPTSERAREAKNDPEPTAAEMLNSESRTIAMPGIRDEFDRVNWTLLARRPRRAQRAPRPLNLNYLDAMAV